MLKTQTLTEQIDPNLRRDVKTVDFRSARLTCTAGLVQVNLALLKTALSLKCDIVKLMTAQEFFIPATVIGELYYGARNSKCVEENVQRIDLFVAENEIFKKTDNRYNFFLDLTDI